MGALPQRQLLLRREWIPLLILPMLGVIPALWWLIVNPLRTGKSPWQTRLIRKTWRFRTLGTELFTLRYDPALESHLNWKRFLERCESERNHLKEQFGFDLRGRVVIYLFAHAAQIAEVFGEASAGFAFSAANMVVVAHERSTEETLRHELVHLFAAQWNPVAAPLLQEGLATHLQGKVDGRPVDLRAFPHLLDLNLRLTKLLKRSFFFAGRDTPACYVLAGSFTGFLVRRFGWETYAQYYRRAHLFNHQRLFVNCFKMSLVQAEWHWRDELMKAMVGDPNMRQKIIAGWDRSLIEQIF
jgi:hypothetical protein